MSLKPVIRTTQRVTWGQWKKLPPLPMTGDLERDVIYTCSILGGPALAWLDDEGCIEWHQVQLGAQRNRTHV